MTVTEAVPDLDVVRTTPSLVLETATLLLGAVGREAGVSAASECRDFTPSHTRVKIFSILLLRTDE